MIYANTDSPTAFKPIGNMRDLGARRYAMPDHLPQEFPLMYSVVAEKP